VGPELPDLPLLLNQWANVVRWELRPRVFLRTSEFLWQEGHTAHATEAEARDYALEILADVYRSTMLDVACVPVLTGHKTTRERFAGATRTWTCEGMMGDGKSLQMARARARQNFAKAFGIQFSDAQGPSSTRGRPRGEPPHVDRAIIMAPGRLRPAPAPVPRPLEVVVVMVKDDDTSAGGRPPRLDPHRARPPGPTRRPNRHRLRAPLGRVELKGVPVRVEVGPRDLARAT